MTRDKTKKVKMTMESIRWSIPRIGNLILRSCVLCLATTLLAAISPSSALAQQTHAPLRAMSFNIRLGVAKDGENHWNKRKDFVVDTIKNYKPDFVGTQETWDFQATYLNEKLSEYTYVGRSRQQDGKGEHSGIFFRKSRFDKLIEGHFWLSESPDQPGSKSWDSSLPRMATWLQLWDRVNQHSFYVINTHFDHRGRTARTESAKLIRKFVSSLPEGSQVVVTGDFNAGATSDPYEAMFGDDHTSSIIKQSPVVDSFVQTHPQPGETDGTFNGFKGTQSGERIDWIAVTRGVEVISANIDRISFGGKFPSDHFPVTAEVRLRKPE